MTNKAKVVFGGVIVVAVAALFVGKLSGWFSGGDSKTLAAKPPAMAKPLPTNIAAAKPATEDETAQILKQANASLQSGKHAETLAALKNLPATNIAALHLRAWAYYQSGDITNAIDSFKKLLDIAPDNYDAHSGLAYSSLRQNNLPEAEKHFSAVLKNNTNDSSALIGLGMVRFRQDRRDDAIKLLQEGLKLAPQDADARNLLDRLLAATNAPVALTNVIATNLAATNITSTNAIATNALSPVNAPAITNIDAGNATNSANPSEGSLTALARYLLNQTNAAVTNSTFRVD